MSITFGEMIGTRGQRSSVFTGTGMSRYTRRFQAVTDNNTYEQSSVYTAFMTWSGCTLGQYYTNTANGVGITDPFSFLYQITVDESTDDGYQWNITLNYSEFDPSQMGGFNPTLAPVQKSITFDQREQAVYWCYTYNSDGQVLDVNGEAVATSGLPPNIRYITNSAGDYFTQPIMKTVSEPVFRVTRNEQDLWGTGDLIATISQYIDCVNVSTWLGFPPKTVKFSNVDVAYMWHPRILSYNTVQYQFRINWLTWMAQPMDAGYKAINPGTGLITPIMDPSGLGLVSQPQPLNGAGSLLPKTTPPTLPVFGSFDIYTPVNYSVFNIS